MLLYVGLLFKYSTVGKPLPAESLRHRLVQGTEYDVPLKPFSSVVQLNSDYMELIDRWNYDRGYLTILSSVFAGLAVLISFLSIKYFLLAVLYGSYEPENWLEIPLGILMSILAPAFLCLVLYGLSRESFTYTYYPTRFNRKRRKVYVIKPNKKLLVANWDDIVFVRQASGQGQFDLRGHILNEQGIVTDAFCLPYVDIDAYSDNMTGHWEFVRRYMEEAAGVEQAYDATDKLFPLSQHKETTIESIERVYLLSSDSGKQNVWSYIFFCIVLPYNLLFLIGRRFSIITSRTPHFPQWVEDECKVDADDPYNLETHPHPMPVAEAKPFSVRVALGALYTVLAMIGICLGAGFIDMISGMKGHDTGLLRMLTFGYLGF